MIVGYTLASAVRYGARFPSDKLSPNFVVKSSEGKTIFHP
jgi:hypothetical protein